MNIQKILKTTAAVTGLVNPMLGGAINFVNSFLDDDKKIPMTATGAEVATKVAGMDGNTQGMILSKEIDLEIKKVESWTDIQKVHAETDQKGASTRPNIAMMMAITVALSVVPISLAIAWAIIDSDNPLKAAADNYLIVLALIGTPTILLKAYFGLRTDEKKARYAASVGEQVNPAGLLSSLLSGKK